MKNIFILLFISFAFAGFTNAQTSKDPNQTKYNNEKKSESDVQRIEKNSISVTNDDNNLPENYPVYVDTGNPEADMESYRQAKLNWYNSHPELKKDFLSDTEDGKGVITQEQFNNLPQQRKDFIIANPDRFIIKNK